MSGVRFCMDIQSKSFRKSFSKDTTLSEGDLIQLFGQLPKETD